MNEITAIFILMTGFGYGQVKTDDFRQYRHVTRYETQKACDEAAKAELLRRAEQFPGSGSVAYCVPGFSLDARREKTEAEAKRPPPELKSWSRKDQSTCYGTDAFCGRK